MNKNISKKQAYSFNTSNNFKIELPEDVSFIINTIEKNGHQAYAVGGCVRDTIMGVVPNDWDITTNALPEEVKSYFNKTIDTGIQHGTVTVLMAIILMAGIPRLLNSLTGLLMTFAEGTLPSMLWHIMTEWVLSMNMVA